jgi:serine kinase of HPr protein (carbohydrate metabolism regulator)
MSPDALHRYKVYGITLASELRHDLPSEPADGSGVIVELRVAQPNTFQTLAAKLPSNPNDGVQQGILEDGSLYMGWEHWLELLVSSDGKSVLCGNRSNSSLEAFDAYVTNFAVSAALVQQGEEPLHATVVEIGDRVVGFLGRSGAGKSTLAAHLVSRGWDLVTDDMLRITFEGDTAFAHPGPCRLKLFEETAKRYLQNAVCQGAFNPASGPTDNLPNENAALNAKLIFQLRSAGAVRSARQLSALFHLEQPAHDSEPSGAILARLVGQDLFTTILSATMNSRHHAPARLQRQFRFAERLARAISVYRLTYPRSYDVLNLVADRICQATTQ